jgi:hypothetical protein
MNLVLASQGPCPWPFVYFHGDAEGWANNHNADASSDDWCAPDLVAGDAPLGTVADGIHDVSVYGKPAKLYLWTYGTANFIVGIKPGVAGPDAYVTEPRPGRHGLVVFEGTAGEKYAKQACEEKRKSL